MNCFVFMWRRVAIATTMLALATVAAPACFAQGSFPAKPVRLLVPYPPGGSTDTLARQLAVKMGERIKQPVVVDNRPGGANAVAAHALASAPADGHTMVINDLAMLAINPALFKVLPYDTKLITTAAIPTRFSFVLLVHPSNPATSLREFVATAKLRPKSLTYGSAGVGNPTHLVMELLKKTTGMDVVHSPYKGGGPALNDLMGAQIDTVMMDIPGALPYIKSGKLKALAVLSAERHPLLAEVPTVAEQGWPGFEFSGWNGIAVHRDTPPQVVVQINALIRELVAEPEFNAWLRGTTVTPDGKMSIAQVGDRVRADADRLGNLVRELGITID